MQNKNSKNKYIEDLVIGLSKYNKTIEDKLKVSRIFGQIDKRANQEFKSLVKYSDNIYKLVKSGNSINAYFKQTKDKIEPIIRRISNDPVYNKLDFILEKSKIQNRFLLKVDNQLSKDLKEIRKKLRNKSHDQVKPVEANVPLDISLLSNNTNNNVFKADYAMVNNLEKESNLFVTNINSYKKLINSIDPKDFEDQKENKEPSSLKDILINKKFDSNFLLNYKLDNKPAVKEDPNKYEELNINKLMKTLNTSKIDYKGKLDKIKDKNKLLINITTDENNEREPYNNVLNSIINEERDCLLLQNDKIKYPNNTVSTVRKEVAKNINPSEEFDRKKEKFDNILFKDIEILKPSEIEKKVARNNINNQNKILAQKLLKSASVTQRNNLYGSDIGIAINNEDQLEKEKKKENKMFLIRANNEKRINQLYIDPYSYYNKEVNENIVKFNKSLGKKNYDKNKLNRKLNDFISKLQNDKQAAKPLPKIEEKKFHVFKFEDNNFVTSFNGIDKDKATSKDERTSRWSLFKNLAENPNENKAIIFGSEDKGLVRKIVEEDWTYKKQQEELKSNEEDFKRFQVGIMKKEKFKIPTEDRVDYTILLNNLLEEQGHKEVKAISEKEINEGFINIPSKNRDLNKKIEFNQSVNEDSKIKENKQLESRLDKLMLKDKDVIVSVLKKDIESLKNNNIKFDLFKPNQRENEFNFIFHKK